MVDSSSKVVKRNTIKLMASLGNTQHYGERAQIRIMCTSGTTDGLLLQWNQHYKDWLARNQDNASEWSDMSTHGLLFK